MSHTYRIWSLALLVLTATLTLFAAIGCHNGPSSTSMPTAAEVNQNAATAPPVDPDAPRGAKIYASKGCGTCHMIDGDGGHSAPQLSQEGNKHDAAWIMAQVKDPKSHNSGSKMPAYDDIQVEDLQALGDYLASLKSATH